MILLVLRLSDRTIQQVPEDKNVNNIIFTNIVPNSVVWNPAPVEDSRRIVSSFHRRIRPWFLFSAEQY